MAHAWKACWVNALGGSNPPSSAKEKDRPTWRSFSLSSLQNEINKSVHIIQSVQASLDHLVVTSTFNAHHQHLHTASQHSHPTHQSQPSKNSQDKCSACSACCASCGLVNSLSPGIATFTTYALIQFVQKSFSNHTPAGLDPPPKHLLS